MRYHLLAAVAVFAVATPALAREAHPYVGVEGGILLPHHSNVTTDATRQTTSQTTSTTTAAGIGGAQTITSSTGSSTRTATYDSALGGRDGHGVDVDAILGYDFGRFSLEGEAAYKRTTFRNAGASAQFVTDINNPGFAGYTPTTYTSSDPRINFGTRTSVLSGMVNGLVNFDVAPAVRAYLGGGAGRARVTMYSQHDNVWAYQGIVGLATAISPNLDLGLKYRYFETARLHYNQSNVGPFTGSGTTTTANPNGSTTVSNTNYSSVYSLRDSGRFRSHSLMASMVYNFGGHAAEAPMAAPAPMMAPPPAPMPVQPATQTCADGSVIDANAACPQPVMAAPAPPPPPSHGERG